MEPRNCDPLKCSGHAIESRDRHCASAMIGCNHKCRQQRRYFRKCVWCSLHCFQTWTCRLITLGSLNYSNHNFQRLVPRETWHSASEDRGSDVMLFAVEICVRSSAVAVARPSDRLGVATNIAPSVGTSKFDPETTGLIT